MSTIARPAAVPVTTRRFIVPGGDCAGALVGSTDKSSVVDLAWRRYADRRMARLKPWSRLTTSSYTSLVRASTSVVRALRVNSMSYARLRTSSQRTSSALNSTLNKKLIYRRESVHLTSLYRTVQKAFRYVEPFRHGSRVWQTDNRRTDGQTFRLKPYNAEKAIWIKLRAYRLIFRRARCQTRLLCDLEQIVAY